MAPMSKEEKANDKQINYLKDHITKLNDEQPFVVISYSNKDSEVVLKDIVYKLVTRYGLRVYFDSAFPTEQKDWSEQLEAHFDNAKCRGMLAFMDDNYATSHATLMELMLCLTNTSGKRLVLVHLNRLSNDDNFSDVEKLNMSDKSKNLFDKYYKDLIKIKKYKKFKSKDATDQEIEAPMTKIYEPVTDTNLKLRPNNILTLYRCHRIFSILLSKLPGTINVYKVNDSIADIVSRMKEAYKDVFGEIPQDVPDDVSAEKTAVKADAEAKAETVKTAEPQAAVPVKEETEEAAAAEGTIRAPLHEFLQAHEKISFQQYWYRLVGIGDNAGYTTEVQKTIPSFIYACLKTLIESDEIAVKQLKKCDKLELLRRSEIKKWKKNPDNAKWSPVSLKTAPDEYYAVLKGGTQPYDRLEILWECIQKSGLNKYSFEIELIPKPTEVVKTAVSGDKGAAKNPGKPSEEPGVSDTIGSKATTAGSDKGTSAEPDKEPTAVSPLPEQALPKGTKEKVTRITMTEFLERYTAPNQNGEQKTKSQKIVFRTENCQGTFRLIGEGEYASLSQTVDLDQKKGGQKKGGLVDILQGFVKDLIREKGNEVYLKVLAIQQEEEKKRKNVKRKLLKDEEFSADPKERRHYVDLEPEPGTVYHLFKNVSGYGYFKEIEFYMNAMNLPLDRFILEFLPDAGGKILTDHDDAPASAEQTQTVNGQPVSDTGL